MIELEPYGISRSADSEIGTDITKTAFEHINLR